MKALEGKLRDIKASIYFNVSKHIQSVFENLASLLNNIHDIHV